MNPLAELDARSIRVLGVLLEKERTTPEYYPLTLKAVTAGCNQKTNRDPVLSLSEIDVLNTLRLLSQEDLVSRETGVRADRWRHRLDERGWYTDKAAILCLLFLRGPQTPGELRQRAERLHPFESVGEVEETLRELESREEAIVRALPRRPGQKETRWALASDSAADVPAPSYEDSSDPSDLARLEALEKEVAELRDRLEELERLVLGG